MSEYIKRFDEWNDVKKHVDTKPVPVHDTDDSEVTFRPGDIRWVVLGVNVGSEIDGKGDSFNRPCIIVDCFANHLALVFPMTTKVKPVPGYVPIALDDGTVGAVCVLQAKTISSKRILKRISTISPDKLTALKNVYKKFYRL